MVDSINIGSVDTGQGTAPEGHDAAMIAKAEGEVNKTPEAPAPAPTEEKPVRPDNIPEKFWDAEKGEVNVDALLKAQADAEAALRKSTAPKEETAETPAGETEVPSTPAVDAAIKLAEQSFAEGGEVSAEAYEALAKAGISKEVVEGYIEGQIAKAAKLTEAAYGALGGEETYTAATAWARDNLSSGEIAAIDALLTSPDPAIVAEGAKMLAAKYNSDNETMPSKTVVGTNTATVGQYFKSSAELVSAMNDPRYRTDAAYRAEVSKKMDAASKAGVSLF